MTDFPSSMLIFGCGNMGGAMLRGWIAGGIEPDRFTVVDPIAQDLPKGVSVYRSASEADAEFDSILLGIKPQMVGDLAGEIGPLITPGATLISILAGTRSETLSGFFPGTHIVRLMPNLAAAIGKSPLALWSANGERADVGEWLRPLGTPIWLSSESQMNGVTALAGSGPAFVYRFIDALASGGAEIGLPVDIAAQLAVATVEGAAQLAAASNASPSELARQVTSPGGTTAAGLAELDKDGVLPKLIEATLRAARDRGDALAKEA